MPSYSIYSNYPSLILGFHGCEKSVGEKILNGKEVHLTPSQNEYDGWVKASIFGKIILQEL